MVYRVQEIAEDKCEQQIEVIRQEMRDMTHKFNVYNEVVAEEVKINEMLRYKQRMLIHKLKDDIINLKKIMVVPRLHSKYMEESRKYHMKKKEGQFTSQKEYDLYDMSSNRSTPMYKQHRSICKDMNDKSRISLPVVSGSINELSQSEEQDPDISLQQKLDFIPGQLFNPKSKIQRHEELVKELKGSRNKPSILNQYKSMANLSSKKHSLSGAGNLTERKTKLNLASLDRKLAASTDFSEDTNQVSNRELPVNIFDKQLAFPKTERQKDLFGKRKHNQSLPQLNRIKMNQDIR